MQNTHISRRVLRVLHESLIDVVGVLNRPQNDVILLREAGVSLDRALFPLLVLIERRGPLGVGELADWIGREPESSGRPLRIRDVLTAMIRAHEIQGVLALENSFNRVGLDHVLLVRVASTAVVASFAAIAVRTSLWCAAPS